MSRRNCTSLNRQTLERLLLYYHFVNNNSRQLTSGSVSSVQIADFINTDETQVRKDFAAIGIKGRPRVGFAVEEVAVKIEDSSRSVPMIVAVYQRVKQRHDRCCF